MEENETTNEVELEELTLDDIEFDGKGLLEYEEEFTIKLPSLPCTSQQATQCLIDIGNAYQNAYNCYNKLLVLSNKAESQFKAMKYRLCNEYISKLRENKVTKLPAKETIETLVVNDDKNIQLRLMLERFQIYEAIKEFFKNNKTKLENTMDIAKSISINTLSSDKIQNQSKVGHGI